MTDDDEKKMKRLVNSISREVQRLCGQVTALDSALSSALVTHHDLDKLSRRLESDFEPIEAQFLGGLQSEIGLTAFQETRARVAAAVKQAIADRDGSAGAKD